jgi:hypothetical protein
MGIRPEEIGTLAGQLRRSVKGPNSEYAGCRGRRACTAVSRGQLKAAVGFAQAATIAEPGWQPFLDLVQAYYVEHSDA